MSLLGDCSVTEPKRMASSIRFSAQSSTDLYSGPVRSPILMPSVFTYLAASGIKGYLAQSLFVSGSFPSLP